MIFKVFPRVAPIALAIAAFTSLSACDNATDSRSPGQKLDAAIANTEKATEGLKAEAKVAGERIKEEASNLGTKIDATSTDARITASVKTQIATDETLNALKINVDTSGGRVTLMGSAPTLAAKEHATAIAKSVDGVVAVDNQLVVASKS